MAIVCGRNRYQVDFPLEAVGLESDGSIQKIDDLSYRPASGWSDIDFPYFANVVGNSSGVLVLNYRELAKLSVFRWYRIKVPVEIPGFGQITTIEQILPLEDEQVETVDEDGVKNNKPASVHGIWFPNFEDLSNVVTALSPTIQDVARYNRPFAIDRQTGIVKFADPVFRNSETSSPLAQLRIGEAQIVLRTAVGVKDAARMTWTRYERTRQAGTNFNTPTRFIKHDEITLARVPVYDSTSYAIQSVTTNIDDVNQECDYYLDAAEQEYQTSLPQTIKYAGIRALELDGAIQQLILGVGPEGATTTVVRNNELSLRAPGYKERRTMERARSLNQIRKKQSLEQQRRDRKVS